MVNVVIIMFQGVIEDVKVFREETYAFKFFEEQTNVSCEVFKARIDSEDSETIRADYAGSNIWEVTVK